MADGEFQVVHGFAILDLRFANGFISKLGTVEEEADESALWMELIVDGGLLPSGQVDALRQEAMELTAIMAASRLMASGRR